MIFLKRIEAFGFKSFAEPITLKFEYGMTGIVGPNGSGKSNINDAIRWTLGEQSLKSLRGDSMEDIVFFGSETKKALNVAEVTLIFDNQNNVFQSLDVAEVAIKRRYDKTTNESEYFINNNRVRRKDVQEIALETGLTKSSLAIISQGSVNHFVEAKPEERRQLFDEAAGVAKYKKRKDETIRKLVRSRENLDRINDIINEIERKLPSLKRQSQKALIYQEKEAELKKHEVSFLMSDIKVFSQRIEEIDSQKSAITEQLTELERQVRVENMQLNSIHSESYKYDKQIDALNQKYVQVLERISKLQVKKVSFEAKNQNQQLNESEHRIEEVKRLSKELEIHINAEEKQLDDLMANEVSLNEQLMSLSNNRSHCNLRLDHIRKQMNKIDLRLESLQNKRNSNEMLFEGVRNVIDNKSVLPGIIGTVQDLITVDDMYLNTIGAFLQQGALQNIVVDTAANVETAIEFLKANRAGHATFLPLDTIRPNFIDNEKRFIIQNGPGFVSFANDLVKIEKQHRLVVDYLLGAVVVVKTYDDALKMAKLISYRFNIVTLDGERIMPQGAIVGGSRKRNVQITNDSAEIEKLSNEHTKLETEEQENNGKVVALSAEIELLREQIAANKSSIGGSKAAIRTLQNDFEKHRDEYRILTGKEIDSEVQGFTLDNELEKIVSEISQLEVDKTNIQNELDVARNMKAKIVEHQNEKNKFASEKRSQLSALKDEQAALNTDLILLRERKFKAAERLAQAYNLTVDSALELELEDVANNEEVAEKIKTLHSEINALGNVNFDAIAEYEEENARYETYTTQADDVRDAINNFTVAIANMDDQMVKQFKQTIKDVNRNLPETFKTLFGGGDAQIVYSNPDDVLNSGIEIKVQPPGKKIINLNLLSGGEKSLVALSVLFSILSARPLPLVILDEVEAPLDPSNVERFAKYIKTFTNRTQFMMVTHRIGTMEHCDVLYGATMEQKGITKIVNIKLVEAKKITNAN